jgi:hypothetical protein
MAAPEPQAITLTCKNCGYNNEPERVYCHNCGEKLDRSVLPKEEQLRRESPERARKRIMRMTNPGASPVRYAITTTLKVLAWAAFIAIGVLTCLPPDDVPPEKGEISMRPASSDLLDLTRSKAPASLVLKQTDINSFMKTARPKTKSAVPGLEYKRTFVNLEPGIARITLEKSMYGFSAYYGTIYRVEANNGVFITANVGGYIGRCAMPQFLMRWLEPVMMKDIKDTFNTEIGQLKQLAEVKIQKGQVFLVSKGAPQ